MSDIYGHVEFYHIGIGNYMVREVLIKKRPRVWRSVYNTASACVARVLARVQFFIKYFENKSNFLHEYRFTKYLNAELKCFNS